MNKYCISYKHPQNLFLEKIINNNNNNDLTFLLGNQHINGSPIVYCNENFIESFLYSKNETLEKSLFTGFMSGCETEHRKIKQAQIALMENIGSKTNLTLYSKTGHKMLVSMEVSPIFNKNDESILYIMIFRRITSLHSLNDYILKKIELSEASSKFGDRNATKTKKMPRYGLEIKKKKKMIIYHYSPFKRLCDWIIIILISYTAIVVPFYVAFTVKISNILTLSELIIDGVFFMDLVLSFRTTYVNEAGKTIVNSRQIAIHYLKTYFFIDLISCFPYHMIEYIEFTKSQKFPQLLAITKIAKMVRLLKLARNINKYVEINGIILIILIFSFIVAAHWLACIWYTIGMYDLSRNVTFGWLNVLNQTINPDQNDLSMKYISALYYTITCITSIGFGNIAPVTFNEKLFTIVMMIIGALMYASIFGNVTTIYARMYSSTTRYQNMMRNLREFLLVHEIPKSLSLKVQEYMTSFWNSEKGINSSKIMKFLPKNLKNEITFNMHRDLFDSYSQFSRFNQKCLNFIAPYIETYYMSPGDILFDKREKVAQIFFVLTGAVEILEKNKIRAILDSGSCFGKNIRSSRGEDKSLFSVRSIANSKIKTIDTDTLILMGYKSKSTKENIGEFTLTFDICSHYLRNKSAKGHDNPCEAEVNPLNTPIVDWIEETALKVIDEVNLLVQIVAKFKENK